MDVPVSKNDIILIYPPYWSLFTPFPALPCLVAHLKKHNFNARQFDLNIEYFNEFLETYPVKTLNNRIIDVAAYRKNFQRWDSLTADMVTSELENAFCRQDASAGCYDMDIIEAIEQLHSREELLSHFVKSEAYKHIMDGSPLVGFSITSKDQFAATFAYCRLLRQNKMRAKIVLGGSYISHLARFAESSDFVKVFDFADFVVCGEGETAITMLADYVINGKGNIDEIPNLIYLTEDLQQTNTERFLENIEELDAPDYSGVALDTYLMPEITVGYQSSRGCYYGHCGFCDHDESYRHNYRKKSSQKIIDDLLYMQNEIGFSHIEFVDEAIEPKHFGSITSAILESNELEKFQWFSYLRISPLFNDEVLKKAKDAGCRMVFFGVETFNQRVSKLIRKGINTQIIGEVLRSCKANEIKTHIWLIGGLPSQTCEELEEDMEALKQLSETLDGVGFGPFRLEKASDMYAQPHNFNICSIDEETKMFISHKEGIVVDNALINDVVDVKYWPLVVSAWKSKSRYVVYFRDYLDKYLNSLVKPLNEIPSGSRLVLYGAGPVGKAVHKLIADTNNHDIVVWLDKDWKNRLRQGLMVSPPETVFEIDFDFIFIALANIHTEYVIVDWLIESGVPKEKIITHSADCI